MPPTPAGQLAVPNLHRAARIEDAVHELVQRRLRRTGWRVNIVAYTGYGAPGWVRVMCRVLLGRPDTRQRGRLDKVRGWRSFTTLPNKHVTVTIEAGGVRHETQADRGGFVDTLVEADLRTGLGHRPAQRAGRRAGRRAGAHPRPGGQVRHHLRHRRHRDGDRAAPAAARRVEHVRARRARPQRRARHGRALRAARHRAPRRPGLLPLHGRVERGADADPVPVPAPLPGRAAAVDRLGADRRPAGSAAGGSTSGSPWPGWPRSSPT